MQKKVNKLSPIIIENQVESSLGRGDFMGE